MEIQERRGKSSRQRKAADYRRFLHYRAQKRPPRRRWSPGGLCLRAMRKTHRKRCADMFSG